ncbi:restriction endonuclease [Flavobacterium zepuense]|uniref:Restriction endonuclease n=1 Tax=Flavobacterium zepuense TaxID=2593302 RepID=A0A552V4I6_9FLAO|nr:restriction endonuclease [Flavobacterium zepuense]TRW25352.1 restriction endonuclease [Flavobacterium zepuense]
MSEAKNLDWKTYESITKYIYETLGKQHGVTVKGHGSSCTVKGNSGTSHQIDVLTTHSDGIHSYETAIECKHWKEKVNKDIVMKLSAILEDTGINKGVIVSKSGFTPDGIALAKFKNIGLVELREAVDNDFKDNSRELEIGQLEIRMKIVARRPEILSVVTDGGDLLDAQDYFDFLDYGIRSENGDHVHLIQFVDAFRLEISRIDKELELITKRYDFPNGTLYNRKTQSSIKIEHLIFTGQLRDSDESKNIKFTLVDQVWLIMKSLFEERIFSFSESGLIIENKK